MSAPIQILLSAPGQQELNKVYSHFLSDKRLVVEGLATTPLMLEQMLGQTSPEVAIIDVELLLEQGERGIVEFISSRLGSAVAVVLLPSMLERLVRPISQLDRVREVLIKPVGVAQVIERAYQVGLSERVAREAIAPATSFSASALAQTTGAARAVALSGTRVFAVGGGKGGSGKTTVAVNLAYRLHQVGIRTLLMGFDVPDAVGLQLGLPVYPNSINWFRRPARQSFADSLQNKDGLDVCLSPNDKVDARNLAALGIDQENSIIRLVEAARDHHPPYAAIVMDLPPTESEWSIQPLMRANTVLLVCEPDVASQVNLVATVQLITGAVFTDRYKVPRESIFAVLNRVDPEDTLTPKGMMEAIRGKLDGWAPPFVAVIPADPGVRACQIDFVMPVSRRQEFAAGIDQIVDFFYRDSLGQPAGKAAGKQKNGGIFGIKVRLT